VKVYSNNNLQGGASHEYKRFFPWGCRYPHCFTLIFMLTFFSILVSILPTRYRSTFPPKFGDFFSFLMYFEGLKGLFKVYFFPCLILEAKPRLFLLLWSLKGIDLQTLICLWFWKLTTLWYLKQHLVLIRLKRQSLTLPKAY